MSATPHQCVMDASVLMKYFVPEAETTFVRNMLHRIFADEAAVIAVPDLLFIECANVLWKKVQRQQMSVSLAEESLHDLAELGLSVTRMQDLHARALRLACDHQVSAYDACYLALAEKLSLPLIIADARLAVKAAGTSLTIITLDALMGRNN